MLTRRRSISSSGPSSSSKDVLSPISQDDLPSEETELYVLINEFVKQYDLEIEEKARVPKGHYTKITLEKIFRHPNLDQALLSILNPRHSNLDQALLSPHNLITIGRIISVYASIFSASEVIRDQKSLIQIQANCHRIATFIFSGKLPPKDYGLRPIDERLIQTFEESLASKTEISPDLLLASSSTPKGISFPLNSSSSSSSMQRALPHRSIIASSAIEIDHIPRPSLEMPDLKSTLLNCSEETIQWFKSHPANPLFYAIAFQTTPSIDDVCHTKYGFENFYSWCITPIELFDLFKSVFAANLAPDVSKKLQSAITGCVYNWVHSNEHSSELENEEVRAVIKKHLAEVKSSDQRLNNGLNDLKNFIETKSTIDDALPMFSMIENSHLLQAFQCKTPEEFKTAHDNAQNIADELKNAFCHLLSQTPLSAFLTYSGKVDETSPLVSVAMANQQLSNKLTKWLHNKTIPEEETSAIFKLLIAIAQKSILISDYNTAYIIYSRLYTISKESEYEKKLDDEQRLQYENLKTLYDTQSNWRCLRENYLRENYLIKDSSSSLFVPVIEITLRDLCILKEVKSHIEIEDLKLEKFVSFNPDKHLKYVKIVAPFLNLKLILIRHEIVVSQSLINFLVSNDSFFSKESERRTGHPICSSSTDSSGSTGSFGTIDSGAE